MLKRSKYRGCARNWFSQKHQQQKKRDRHLHHSLRNITRSNLAHGIVETIADLPLSTSNLLRRKSNKRQAAKATYMYY